VLFRSDIGVGLVLQILDGLFAGFTKHGKGWC